MSATMTQSRWPVTMVTESPIHHGAFGADTGNAVLHRRVPLAAFPSHPGVPAISGNALRGVLRRILMRDLFDLVTLSRTTAVEAGFSLAQWDKLYAALANGGHLSSSETRTDPERIRALRDAVPALSLLGASLYSFMLAGRVSIGWMWPVCAETLDAGICTGTAPRAAGEDLLTEITLVRHIDREIQDPASSGVTPMPVTIEALVPGVELQGTIICLKAMTAIERGALAWGLRSVDAIGGKSSSGFGRVRVTVDGLDASPYEAWRADTAAIATARAALIDLARSF